jgi:hypothetical protein
VTIEGASTYNGDEFVIAVFAEGVYPLDEDPLAIGVGTIEAGSATVLAKWLNEYGDPEGTFTGEGGVDYDVYMFIDGDGNQEPFQSQDLIYDANGEVDFEPYTYAQQGNVVISTTLSDYLQVTESTGTLTVELWDATAVDGQFFCAFVVPEGDTDLSPGNILAINQVEIIGGSASLTLKESAGDFSPTGTDWLGTAGDVYDIYMYVTEDGENYDLSSFATLHDPFPEQFMLGFGDETHPLSYNYFVEANTFTVHLTDAVDLEGEPFTVGVFEPGTTPDPDTNPPIARWAEPISGGEAEVLLREPEHGSTWLGENGVEYEVYMFIDTDEDSWPSPGDYVFDTNGEGTEAESMVYVQDGRFYTHVGRGEFILYAP